MPNFPLLDIAIGLVFVYLLLSLVCTSLNEGLESILRNRASDLEAGVRRLLSDPKERKWILAFLPWKSSINDGSITREFYLHPLVKTLFQTENRLPTYIPARNFSLAVMDIVAKDGALLTGALAGAGRAIPSVPALNERVNNTEIPEHLRTSIAALVTAAQGDVEQIRLSIEGWFNGTMDRVSGWYKRRTQFLLFGIGLFVTIAINADTLAIVNALSHSKNLDAIISAATQTASQPRSATDVNQQVTTAMGQLQSLDLGIGWLTSDESSPTKLNQVPPGFFTSCAGDACQHPLGWLAYLVYLHWLGWLVTASAIALGAPFWFDTLNRFIVVRSTIKPREKSQEEQSKDN